MTSFEHDQYGDDDDGPPPVYTPGGPDDPDALERSLTLPAFATRPIVAWTRDDWQAWADAAAAVSRRAAVHDDPDPAVTDRPCGELFYDLLAAGVPTWVIGRMTHAAGRHLLGRLADEHHYRQRRQRQRQYGDQDDDDPCDQDDDDDDDHG